MVETKELTSADMWILRASLFCFGVYCVSFTVRPLIQKVFLSKSIGLTYVLKKQTRFINLVNAGAGCAFTFPLFDLIPHNLYYSIISLFAGLFVLTETYISFKRVPYQLVSPNMRQYLRMIILGQSVVTIFRVIVDVFFIIYDLTCPYTEEVYIAVRVVRMACAALFAVTEFSVSKVTLDLISKPQDDMCLEMKLHLKDTKSKLHALAQANTTGGVAALIDIFNSWFEIQLLQALVIAVASSTFIFYGRLFRIGLEETERMQKKELEESSSSYVEREVK